MDRLFSMGTASCAVSTLSPAAATRRATRRRPGAAESADRGRGRGRAVARLAGSAGATRHAAADLGTATASIGAGGGGGGGVGCVSAADGTTKMAIGTRSVATGNLGFARGLGCSVERLSPWLLPNLTTLTK
jgi:hypothetical protein